MPESFELSLLERLLLLFDEGSLGAGGRLPKRPLPVNHK